MKYILTKEVLAPIFIILGSILVYNIIKVLIMKTLRLKKRASNKEKTIINLINNLLKYIIFFIAFLLILKVYGIDTGALLASLGIVGLVVGLALQDIIKDFIAGIFIILDNQYSIGDNVTISGFRGEVIFLGLKSTKIKSFSGEVKIITNRNITEIINHSLENSLAIIDFPVSRNNDLEYVKKTLETACKDLSKKIDGIIGEITLLGISSVSPLIIRYRIIAETKPLENFRIEREIREELSKKLYDCKVDLGETNERV